MFRLAAAAIWAAGFSPIALAQPTESVVDDGPAVLRVGVTLPVYASWLANLAGDRIEIVSILPEGVDPHIHRPGPDDLRQITTLDAVVENGLGHDLYLDDLLTAADRADLPRIRPATDSALLRSDDGTLDGHSFLSILGATREIRTLAEALAQLDPAGAERYRAAARAYVRRLRGLLVSAQERLGRLGPEILDVPVATVHDGYGYLFQELGLEVAAVIQPRHGVEPSAKQLADTVRRIRESRVRVLFTEMHFARRHVETLYRETGCRLALLSHGTRQVEGEIALVDQFEYTMRTNLDSILSALEAVHGDLSAAPSGP